MLRTVFLILGMFSLRFDRDMANDKSLQRRDPFTSYGFWSSQHFKARGASFILRSLQARALTIICNPSSAPESVSKTFGAISSKVNATIR